MTESFDKSWDHLNLSDEDLRKLENSIAENPNIGDVISNTGGVRKMRFAIETRGKSRSSRIIYIFFTSHATVALLLAYKKNEYSDLSENGKKMLKALAKEIENNLDRWGKV
ncbi:MAG: type II toxin-antitoxin system RelE/ParE family toxin [Flexilinea sp.]